MSDGGNRGDRLDRNQRRNAARDKARTLRELHKKRERRGRIALAVSLTVVSLAIVVTVTLILVNSIRPPAPGPLNMISDGIILGANYEARTTPALAAGDAPPAATPSPSVSAATIPIEVWVDYQCKECAAFDVASSEQVKTLLQQGAVTLEIHPVAVLDRASLGARYSSRAANAVACVANYSPSSFYAVNSLVLSMRPQDQTAGLSDEELIRATADAGVGQASRIAECITDKQFKNWVKDATERAVANPALFDDAGKFVTPTILVGGNRYTGAPDDPTAFAKFVAATDGAVFSDQTAASPSPSPVQPPPPPVPPVPVP